MANEVKPTPEALCDVFVGVGLDRGKVQLALQRAIERGILSLNKDWIIEVPPDGWQPIETAPRDGKPILLTHRKWPHPWICKWDGGEESFKTIGDASMRAWPWVGIGYPASHWQPLQPLPEPPKEDE